MAHLIHLALERVGAQMRREAEARSEAERMIQRYRGRAYAEARDRARGRCIDGARPRAYWTRVKLEIARRQNIVVGLAGADLRA